MTDPWNLRPARDHGLAPAQRWRSPAREPGLGSRLTTGAWRRLIATYLAAFHRMRVTGREHLPAEPPFVMIANHSSHLDALALAAALPPSLSARAFALAAGDTFFTTGVKSAFAAYAINALPVWRGKTSADDLETLRDRLIEDRSVLILFPEGTRTRTGDMAAFKSGIGALVAGAAAPVVPCYLHGAFAAWPPGRKLPKPARLELRIGEPLAFADYATDRPSQRLVAEECEAAVRALSHSPIS